MWAYLIYSTLTLTIKDYRRSHDLIYSCSYGMALTHGDEGYIKCKIARINERGLSANFNVSVIIEAPFGATSHQASSLHVSATSSLFMYQSFAGKCTNFKDNSKVLCFLDSHTTVCRVIVFLP